MYEQSTNILLVFIFLFYIFCFGGKIKLIIITELVISDRGEML